MGLFGNFSQIPEGGLKWMTISAVLHASLMPLLTNRVPRLNERLCRCLLTFQRKNCDHSEMWEGVFGQGVTPFGKAQFRLRVNSSDSVKGVKQTHPGRDLHAKHTWTKHKHWENLEPGRINILGQI